MRGFVEVLHSDESIERYRIEGEEVSVGSSPRAGIALVSTAELHPEHFVLIPRREGCMVGLGEAARGTVRVDDLPFDGGFLPWGTELEIGTLRLRLADRPTRRKTTGKKDVSPAALLAAIALAIGAMWMFMPRDDSALPSATDAEPPVLFEDSGHCDRTAAAALQRAADAVEAAELKAERYVFDFRDGVEAVRLYHLAEACFQVAAEPEGAHRVQMRRKGLQRRIEDDYRTRRFRLQRALEQGRYESALRAVRDLLQMTDGFDGPYRDWLIVVGRRLQLALSSAQKGTS